MPTIGERIKEVRTKKKGWTQERLAEKAGVSKGFLSDVENRGKNISLDLLLKIATALGVSVGYLASGEGTQATERRPITIPPELSEAAEKLGLSFQETIELLEAYSSVVARRSNRLKRTMTAEDWTKLHWALNDVVKKVYG